MSLAVGRIWLRLAGGWRKKQDQAGKSERALTIYLACLAWFFSSANKINNPIWPHRPIMEPLHISPSKLPLLGAIENRPNLSSCRRRPALPIPCSLHPLTWSLQKKKKITCALKTKSKDVLSSPSLYVWAGWIRGVHKRISTFLTSILQAYCNSASLDPWPIC
jgi:hypothetical protein